MSHEQKKSRRRFLADMLFLGGGLTAAGVLARSQLMVGEGEPGPQTVGAMEMPEAQPTCASTPRAEATTTPTGPEPPSAGLVAMPEPPKPKECPPPPRPVRDPMTRGIKPQRADNPVPIPAGGRAIPKFNPPKRSGRKPEVEGGFKLSRPPGE